MGAVPLRSSLHRVPFAALNRSESLQKSSPATDRSRGGKSALARAAARSGIAPRDRTGDAEQIGAFAAERRDADASSDASADGGNERVAADAEHCGIAAGSVGRRDAHPTQRGAQPRGIVRVRWSHRRQLRASVRRGHLGKVPASRCRRSDPCLKRRRPFFLFFFNAC